MGFNAHDYHQRHKNVLQKRNLEPKRCTSFLGDQIYI